MLLEVSGLSKRFGGLTAVDKLDISVEEGSIVGLIGPNGAGKSTVFNLITGVVRPTAGRVRFEGKDIAGRSPNRVAARGIGRTFQLTSAFPDFTVLQNVTESCYLHSWSGFWNTFFDTPAYRRNEAHALERSMEILATVGLYELKDDLAKNLPHGHHKMLGVARALAVQPRLLLLDEPLGGMNSDEIEFTMAAIKKVQEHGVTVLIIEHNMSIMDLCKKIVVINFGSKIFEGTPEEVVRNPRVMEVYLGRQHVA
jgi:branched-chain amino acid transport system ATP-binding protein